MSVNFVSDIYFFECASQSFYFESPWQKLRVCIRSLDPLALNGNTLCAGSLL